MAVAARHAPRVPHQSLVLPIGGRRKLTAEKVCRLCGAEWTKWRIRTRHHLVPQSWFCFAEAPIAAVVHAQANLVPLCRPCHDDVHSRHPVVRERACAKLRLSMTQQEIAFVIALRGPEWLELMYPLDRPLALV